MINRYDKKYKIKMNAGGGVSSKRGSVKGRKRNGLEGTARMLGLKDWRWGPVRTLGRVQ